METRLAHLGVSLKRRKQLRKATKRYREKLLALGFPGGRTPVNYLHKLQYCAEYDRRNPQQRKLRDARCYQKSKLEFGTGSKSSPLWYLGRVRRAEKRMEARKQRMRRYLDANPTT